MDDYTVIDESTMRQMNALKADRAAALTVIDDLRKRDASSAELIDTLTANNVELKREIRKVKYECRRTVTETKDNAKRREAIAAIFGAVAGFLMMAVIVIIYYSTRFGLM